MPGVYRQKYNVETRDGDGWRVVSLNCPTPGNAEGAMDFLKAKHPDLEFRVVPVKAFVPHRSNYR